MSKESYGLHILLIDDEEITTRLTGEGLQRSGHRITAFTDPLKALEFLEKVDHKVDLILTDKNMPTLCGVKLANHIRTQLNLKLPILLLTGFLESGEEEFIHENGVNHILLKPISIKEMDLKIRELYHHF